MKRSEYPRPQFQRNQWTCLNGQWEFAFDDEDKGLDQHWQDPDRHFPEHIEVPFVYQSQLSGIHSSDSHAIVWYRRSCEINGEQGDNRVLLHFGAIDYESDVYVNGTHVVHHRGGYTPVDADITAALIPGDRQIITVRALDEPRNEEIPRGKQFWKERPEGIWYTPSTGIWQSVWWEVVPATHLERVEFTPNIDAGMVDIEAFASNVSEGDILEYAISFRESEVANGSIHWPGGDAKSIRFSVDILHNHIMCSEFHGDQGWMWRPDNPQLFDVKLKLSHRKQSEDNTDNHVPVDEVRSYFGMRKVHAENGLVYLNNKPFYQKLVLDQGYWPEGLLTAPSDEAFVEDIRIAQQMGFNGCRKHQKVEDPRFLYWADHMGFLVWGECASAPAFSREAVNNLMDDWQEILTRDYNHPSIVTWVPLNESWGVPQIHTDARQQHFSQAMYHYIHAIDSTRLVESNDGWEQTQTDICAIHNYTQGGHDDAEATETFAQQLSDTDHLVNSQPAGWSIYARGFSHCGEPILLTEFGGTAYSSDSEGWGYQMVNNTDEFVAEYARLIRSIRNSKALWGYCYTQLSDVEQEMNGLVTYDRRPKCDFEKIRQINDSVHPLTVE